MVPQWAVMGTQAPWSAQKWEGKGPLKTSPLMTWSFLIFHWSEYVTPAQLLKRVVLIKQRRRWHPTPVLLPGKSHRPRSLVGCSPWGHEELDERLHFHFSLSLFTFKHWRRKWQPTPVSCLENPRDRGAWWAAVYRVTQSRTRLKRLNSSSNSSRKQKARNILRLALRIGINFMSRLYLSCLLCRTIRG